MAAIIGVLATFVFAIFWQGWVVSVLWGWFVVPLGQPSIGAAQAVGITILANTILRVSRARDEQETSFLVQVGVQVFLGLIALGLGWAMRGYM